MNKSADTPTTEYRRGLEDAAKIADTYAQENFLLAGDTIHLDPVLAGRDFSEAAQARSDALTLDGHMHSSMAHAAQHIAEAIRARSTKA